MSAATELSGIHARSRSKAGAELFRDAGCIERRRCLEMRSGRQIACPMEGDAMHIPAVLVEPDSPPLPLLESPSSIIAVSKRPARKVQRVLKPGGSRSFQESVRDAAVVRGMRRLIPYR